ncbi:hypothetical protein [Tessaracoccus sp. G1721]
MRHLLVPLAVVALAVGCTPDVTPTASPTVSVSPTPAQSPSPTPSPSPTAVESFPPAPATESPDQAAIRAAWMEYWEVRSRFVADPTLTDLSETQRVTTGEAEDLILASIRNLRNAGQRSVGGLEFRGVNVGVPREEVGGLAQADVTYCLDRSNVQLLDSSGAPVAVEGPTTLDETATLERGQDGVWRVALIRNEAAQC